MGEGERPVDNLTHLVGAQHSPPGQAIQLHRHPAAIPVIRIRETDLPFYAGAEPIPNDPATPEGRYRKDFRTGWLDGYQDGRAIISYMLKPPPGEPRPRPTIINKPNGRNGGRNDET